MKLMKRVSSSDQSDQTNNQDKIIEELISESPVKTKDYEEFYLEVPIEPF